MTPSEWTTWVPTRLPRSRGGHRASEEALTPRANRLLVCDTEAVVTKAWSLHFAGTVPPVVEAMAAEDRYHLYVLSAATAEWVYDGSRVHERYAERKAFEDLCRRELEARGRRYVVLDGGWDERFRTAVVAVEAILTGPAGH